MRTVSFSASSVRVKLAQDFVCTYTNIDGGPSTGGSFAHAPNEVPGFCQRGSGQQNVQLIFMTPSGNIFHATTGFLSPQDLLHEIAFAFQTFRTLESAPLKSAEPDELRQRLIEIHTERLKGIGISRRELAAIMTPPIFVHVDPSGSQMTVKKTSVAGGDARQRLLRDIGYVLRNPLIHLSQFERDPGSLVGHHSSFFGSRGSGFGRQP